MVQESLSSLPASLHIPTAPSLCSDSPLCSALAGLVSSSALLDFSLGLYFPCPPVGPHAPCRAWVTSWGEGFQCFKAWEKEAGGG